MKRCEYIVNRTYVTLPTSGLTINLDTPEWLDFVESGVNSFHYIYHRNCTFTATLRGSNNYWYATKTVLNNKRNLYIGKTESLTVEKLSSIAREINLPELAWRVRKC